MVNSYEKVIKNANINLLAVGEEIAEKGLFARPFIVTSVLNLSLGGSYAASIWEDNKYDLISKKVPDPYGFMKEVNELLFPREKIGIGIDTLSTFLVEMAGPYQNLYNGGSNDEIVSFATLDRVPDCSLKGFQTEPVENTGFAIATYGLSTGLISPVIRRVAVGGLYKMLSKHAGTVYREYHISLAKVMVGTFVGDSSLAAHTAVINGLSNPIHGGRADGNR